MKISSTMSTPGLSSLFTKTAWVLMLVTLISTPGLMEEVDEHETHDAQLPNSSVMAILETIKEYLRAAPRDQQMDSTISEEITSRIRKAATHRPKFDPGFKWMGLGKRPSVAMGPHMLSDLRQYFQSARNKLAREYMDNSENNRLSDDIVDQDLKQDKMSSGETLKFVHRSKESGERKSYYNPSLLWTGLGR